MRHGSIGRALRVALVARYAAAREALDAKAPRDVLMDASCRAAGRIGHRTNWHLFDAGLAVFVASADRRPVRAIAADFIR